MAARREKGLCYNCDEPFVYGHICKQRISYMIMEEEEKETQNSEDSNLNFEEKVVYGADVMEEVQMSLNALAGEDGITTMRLFGEYDNHKLHILIDSGSTLSFVQAATAKRLNCPITPVKPLLVKVANGQKLVSSQQVKPFSWEMQGHKFSYPLRLLENEGCGLILGGDWLKSCTAIELDYAKMTFTVNLMGKRVKLQALTSSAECKFLSDVDLYRMVHLEGKADIEE